MSSAQTMSEEATQACTPATVDLKLEVAIIPVADVDRSKQFYRRLGWRLDAELRQRPSRRSAAENVASTIIPGSGHWVAEEAPDQLLAALITFLAPDRDAATK